MSIPLTIAPLDTVCERIAPDHFDPFVDHNTVVRRREERPLYRMPEIHHDGGEDVDYRAFFDLNFNLKDRADTWLCHYHKALVVPDVLAVIDEHHRFVFPNAYVETTPEQIKQYYFDRSAMLYTVCHTGSRSAVLEYALDDSAPAEVVEEPAVLLAHQSAINHYHLLSEIAPKLWAFQAYPALKDCRIIIQAPPSANFRYFLERVGIDPARLMVLDRTRLYRFAHLILPSAIGDMAPIPRKFDFVRSFFPFFDTPRRPVPGRRYYLTRSDARVRRAANEPQLITLLERFGVQTVAASTLSLTAQAELLGEAELLVGLYGAGLANMIFMPRGAAVVELNCKGWDGGCWRLAPQGGLSYHTLISRSDLYVENRNMSRSACNPYQMDFDFERLAALLNDVCGRLIEAAAGDGAIT